jgi:NifU-like protein involved in Fe-S cluster formation
MTDSDAASEEASYSELVRRHFAEPSRIGELAPAEDVIHGEAGSLDGGARFRFGARISMDQLSDVRVRVYGCPHCIAAASWAADQLVGLSREALESWSWREAERALGVPPQKRGRLLILEDAIRALARAWRERE